jgi:hypothetical protein
MTRAGWKTILAVAVILGAGLPAAAASTAAASTTAQAARMAGHTSAVPVFMGSLGGVSATSTADAWAVGNQCPSCGNPGTLILHWDGSRWSTVPSPDPGPKGNLLNAVAAVSPSDAWAVGTYANSMCSEAATVILRWNGTKWSPVKSPNFGACNFLDGINASSATSAWAVGGSCTVAVNHCHTLIERWNGTTWSKVASPNPGPIASLNGVTAVSPTDVWVTGDYCAPKCGGHIRALIMHWNGTAWTVSSG